MTATRLNINRYIVKISHNIATDKIFSISICDQVSEPTKLAGNRKLDLNSQGNNNRTISQRNIKVCSVCCQK